jgi:hypothetical protein
MDNFIFSLNATVPVFFIIFMGWFLKRIGIIDEKFSQVNDKLSFKVLFPLLLFKDISSADLKQDFDIRFALFCFIGTIICFAVIWIMAEIFIKDKSIIGSFVQGSFRGSAAILGVAFVENMYGSAGMVPLMIVAAVPLYNIFSVIILTVRGKDNRKISIKSLLMSIVTNPMIIGIFTGLPFALLEVHFPAIIEKCISNLSVLTTPLALLSVGAGFEIENAVKKLKPSIAASLIKLVMQPAILLPVAVLMGFRNQEIIAILIMTGAPTTVSSFIMAKNMNNDAELASSIVVITTLFSAITITGIIFIFRTLGYV